MKRTEYLRWLIALVIGMAVCICLAIQDARASDLVEGAHFSVNAKAALVMEASTGRVLFAQNENTRLGVASTTKVLSALITLEQPGLDEPFVVDPQAIIVEGSSMGLVEGDIVTLRTLAYGMLLSSGNDAANAAAVKIAGSVPAFADMMNARVAELGLHDTHFANPSGLSADDHYSTAYDMAVIFRAAMANEHFAKITACKSAKLQYGNPPYDRWLSNHNRLLSLYSATIGGKTGFTKEAGRCLVTAACQEDVTLICVTLDAPDDWDTQTALYQRYFDRMVIQQPPTVPEHFTVHVVGGTAAEVGVVPQNSAALPMAESEFYRISHTVFLPRFVYAPVQKGDVVGRLDIFIDGEKVSSIPLVATASIPQGFAPRDSRGLQDVLWGIL